MSPLQEVPAHDAVVLYRGKDDVPEHEAIIHRDIATRIADLLDVPFEGLYDPCKHSGRRCYYVPSDTIIGSETRRRLNIVDETDLFGGCAAHHFMPTKAITHGLAHADAARPTGWSQQFSQQVSDATLPGYTAFSLTDIGLATRRLLEQAGVIRLKPVLAKAGRGQVRISSAAELEQLLPDQDNAMLAECGVVLEAHLEEVVTFSVGQVRLPGLVASYIGIQFLTEDNAGNQVYGGSRLQFARGDYDALQALPLDDDRRRAVELARQYDAAADACFPDFCASRRNYDVASGVDAHGRRLMGVLEQSWRIGGASRAEIAALEVFAADPECLALWAETVERFGDAADVPEGAIETFSGNDPALGLIRKYVVVNAYGDQQ